MNRIKLYNELFEGVADTFAKNRFNIETDFSNFDKKYNSMYNKPQEIYRNDKYLSGTLSIIKNPISLNNFDPWVRGVIDSKGNLYLEQEAITIHDRICKILLNLGFIHNYIDDNTSAKYYFEWITNRRNILNSKKPIDEKIKEIDFILVQRESNTNTIKIGEMERHITEDISKYFLNKAKMKNPKINFDNTKIENTPLIKGMNHPTKKFVF